MQRTSSINTCTRAASGKKKLVWKRTYLRKRSPLRQKKKMVQQKPRYLYLFFHLCRDCPFMIGCLHWELVHDVVNCIILIEYRQDVSFSITLILPPPPSFIFYMFIFAFNHGIQIMPSKEDLALMNELLPLFFPGQSCKLITHPAGFSGLQRGPFIQIQTSFLASELSNGLFHQYSFKIVHRWVRWSRWTNLFPPGCFFPRLFEELLSLRIHNLEKGRKVNRKLVEKLERQKAGLKQKETIVHSLKRAVSAVCKIFSREKFSSSHSWNWRFFLLFISCGHPDSVLKGKIPGFGARTEGVLRRTDGKESQQSQ